MKNVPLKLSCKRKAYMNNIYELDVRRVNNQPILRLFIPLTKDKLYKKKKKKKKRRRPNWSFECCWKPLYYGWIVFINVEHSCIKVNWLKNQPKLSGNNKRTQCNPNATHPPHYKIATDKEHHVPSYYQWKTLFFPLILSVVGGTLFPTI